MDLLSNIKSLQNYAIQAKKTETWGMNTTTLTTQFFLFYKHFSQVHLRYW